MLPFRAAPPSAITRTTERQRGAWLHWGGLLAGAKEPPQSPLRPTYGSSPALDSDEVRGSRRRCCFSSRAPGFSCRLKPGRRTVVGYADRGRKEADVTAVRHRAHPTGLLAVRFALVLLVAVAGLACARNISTADSPLGSAAHSAARTPAHAQSPRAGDDSPATPSDATASAKGCTGKHAKPAQTLVTSRHETSAPCLVAGPGALSEPSGPGDDRARALPGRGGPAPPAPPSLEALSVLRV